MTAKIDVDEGGVARERVEPRSKIGVIEARAPVQRVAHRTRTLTELDGVQRDARQSSIAHAPPIDARGALARPTRRRKRGAEEAEAVASGEGRRRVAHALSARKSLNSRPGW